MPSNTPFYVMVGPADIYLAPVGTAFPTVAAAPSGSWTLLGTGGKNTQREGGVKIMMSHSPNEYRTEGFTAPIKLGRSQESLKISFECVDMSPSVLAIALRGETVTAESSSVDSIALYRGDVITEYALLARMISPLNTAGNTFKAQFQIPRCAQTGSPSPVFAKGQMTGAAFEFTALVDLTAATEDLALGTWKIRKAS